MANNNIDERHPFHNRGALLGVALCALLALGACAPELQYKRVQLEGPQPAKASDPGTRERLPLRVAVSGVISPKETFKTYQDLLSYLGSRVGREPQLVQRKTYAEVNNLIRDGGIDLAFVCTLAYVLGKQEFGMEAIAVPEINGEARYRAYVIVPRDSPIEGIEQLRGKVFAFTDPDSNTGRLVPIYLLTEMGENAEGFFRRTVYTYSHDNSIKAVADKLVDGASVDSLVYDLTVARHPEIAARTRVIFRSEPFGAPPVVTHPSQSALLKQQLQDVILGMADDRAGRAILDKLSIDRFVVPSDESYEPVRAMLRKVREAK